MGDIVKTNFYTKGDINPDGVLEGAIGELEQVVVIGITNDGNDYFAASTGNKGKLLLAVEAFKFKLLNGDLN